MIERKCFEHETLASNENLLTRLQMACEWQEVVWPSVYGSLLPKMRNKLDKAPHAYPLTLDNGETFIGELLGNGVFQAVQIVGLENIPCGEQFVTYGGPCLIPSGDLKVIRSDWTADEVVNFLDTTYPRLHQIVEGVGVTHAEKTILILEDDLFLGLLQRKIQMNPLERAQVLAALQRVGLRATEMIGRFHSAVKEPGSYQQQGEIIPLFTSSIRKELQLSTAEMAKMLGEPLFAAYDRAIVDVTYTGLFRQLLVEKGLVGPDQWLVCAEPWEHFMTHDLGSGLGFDRKGLLDRFYQEHPYGDEGVNNKMGIVAIPLTYSSGGVEKDLPFQEVVNKANLSEVVESNALAYAKGITSVPFPLNMNKFLLTVGQLGWAEASKREDSLNLFSIATRYATERKVLNTSLEPIKKDVISWAEQVYADTLPHAVLGLIHKSIGTLGKEILDSKYIAYIDDTIHRLAENMSSYLLFIYGLMDG